jgi:hypothetical protein
MIKNLLLVLAIALTSCSSPKEEFKLPTEEIVKRSAEWYLTPHADCGRKYVDSMVSSVWCCVVSNPVGTFSAHIMCGTDDNHYCVVDPGICWPKESK